MVTMAHPPKRARIGAPPDPEASYGELQELYHGAALRSFCPDGGTICPFAEPAEIPCLIAGEFPHGNARGPHDLRGSKTVVEAEHLLGFPLHIIDLFCITPLGAAKTFKRQEAFKYAMRSFEKDGENAIGMIWLNEILRIMDKHPEIRIFFQMGQELAPVFKEAVHRHPRASCLPHPDASLTGLGIGIFQVAGPLGRQAQPTRQTAMLGGRNHLSAHLTSGWEGTAVKEFRETILRLRLMKEHGADGPLALKGDVFAQGLSEISVRHAKGTTKLQAAMGVPAGWWDEDIRHIRLARLDDDEVVERLVAEVKLLGRQWAYKIFCLNAAVHLASSANGLAEFTKLLAFFGDSLPKAPDSMYSFLHADSESCWRELNKLKAFVGAANLHKACCNGLFASLRADSEACWRELNKLKAFVGAANVHKVLDGSPVSFLRADPDAFLEHLLLFQGFFAARKPSHASHDPFATVASQTSFWVYVQSDPHNAMATITSMDVDAAYIVCSDDTTMSRIEDEEFMTRLKKMIDAGKCTQESKRQLAKDLEAERRMAGGATEAWSPMEIEHLNPIPALRASPALPAAPQPSALPSALPTAPAALALPAAPQTPAPSWKPAAPRSRASSAPRSRAPSKLRSAPSPFLSKPRPFAVTPAAALLSNPTVPRVAPPASLPSAQVPPPVALAWNPTPSTVVPPTVALATAPSPPLVALSLSQAQPTLAELAAFLPAMGSASFGKSLRKPSGKAAASLAKKQAPRTIAHMKLDESSLRAMFSGAGSSSSVPSGFAPAVKRSLSADENSSPQLRMIPRRSLPAARS